MTITTEVIRRVYVDDEGVCLEVRPDQDGLEAVEIHTPDKESQEYFGSIHLTIDKQLARALGEALIAATA